MAYKKCTITMEFNNFQNNNASHGGALYFIDSTITMDSISLHENVAALLGGAMFSENSFMESSDFQTNSATQGGALYSLNSTIATKCSSFHNISTALDTSTIIHCINGFS